MEKIWTIIMAAVGLIGTVVTILSLETDDPLRFPFMITTLTLLTVGVVCSLFSYRPFLPLRTILPTCRKLGIIRIHPQGKSGQEMDKHLESASNIKIIAVAPSGFLSEHRQSLTKALENGTNIRVLISKEGLDFAKEQDLMEPGSREGKDEVSAALNLVMQIIDGIRTEAKPNDRNAIGCISVARYNTHYRNSMIICGNDWAWLTINLPPTKSMYSCSIEVKKHKDGLLDAMSKHFERMWGLAEEDKN